MIPRVNPKIKYGIWVIMMWLCRFINCDKCITLVRKLDSRRGGVYMGGEGIGEISVPFTQFCCEPKTALYLEKECEV